MAVLGCSSCAFTEQHKAAAPPAPALLAAVPGSRKLLGSSVWNSTACTSMREREKDGTPRAARTPGSPPGAQAASDSQQAQMLLFMPHLGNQLLSPQQLLSSSGAPTFPRSWNRGLLYAGSLGNG